MKILLSVLLIAIFTNAIAQKKQVCITVDDLPTVPYALQSKDHDLEITQKLIDTFTKNSIPAIGYVNERKLYPNGKLNQSKVELLELWLENGLEFGNHTYSHLNYHKVTFQEFTEDIIKGEKVTKKLAKKYNTKVKYFRHPYLRSGLDKEHTDSLKKFLAENNYTEAPVTIDNEDYLFAKAYSMAYKNQDSELMKRIGENYIDYMEEKLIFYENMSTNLFGRNIAQTLLVHASLLNAHYMDELVEMFQKHQYEFVSQETVLTDTAYQEEVTKFGDWGISWLDRWALSKGKRGDFFKGDPVTPEFILEMNK
ncbi:polysaccharide deacetylase family protein [Flexithrix dorotheae]|uniref:polysaccharide deacetylase family protein n=1 Tax=Flexithrix dorotheae TaxID=70993 RepID=UPI0003788EB7|nr:polysaccharide deacetylase family protein [Flexithrix dorotheae]